ncbi:hypothetical protein TA3x_000538 [Tundrisphaera sp. TA3]|uniref:hypothetical protein n=1 Tax=Tundrisphaera sp. TA3 TaxID=3435775 RepID=UPI003EB9AD7C
MLKTTLAGDIHDHRPNATAHHPAFRSGREHDRAHRCDGCGEAKPEIDLWAEDDETGEELWLCLACGDW